MAIGLGLLISSVSVADAKAQVLPEILRRMDLNNKSLQSLSADVTMVKFDSALKLTDTRIGTTSYLPKTQKRGMYARIEWKSENNRPLDESISVIGDEYEMYRPRLNQVITGKVQNAKNGPGVGNALGFMNMSKDQLKANYTVIYIGQEQISGGTQTWHLQLTPKSTTSYKMAELWVDGDGMPRQSKIIELNNDWTMVLLANMQKNVTLKGEIFKLKYPSSVKKIRA